MAENESDNKSGQTGNPAGSVYQLLAAKRSRDPVVRGIVNREIPEWQRRALPSNLQGNITGLSPGRVPKLAENRASPDSQSLGQRLRPFGMELVEHDRAGDLHRCICRILASPKEMAARFQTLLERGRCRVYREYMMREDRFVSAYVLEFRQADMRKTMSTVVEIGELVAPRVEKIDLPTDNPDRNRPLKEFRPCGDEGQAGAHPMKAPEHLRRTR